MLPDLEMTAPPVGRYQGRLSSDPTTPILPAGADDGTDDTAAAFFRNCYAVLVRGKTVRRHLYFNLPAATRAVKRAHDRGDRADLVLVKLVPVDARHLDDREVI